MGAELESEIDKMIARSLNDMNRAWLKKCKARAVEIVAKREFAPELHPHDCRCLRCISLRV